MSVQLYEGCFGITRGWKVVGPIARNTLSYRETHPWRSSDTGSTYRTDGAWSEKEGDSDDRDIISVHATREEAEAELRRKQGDASADPVRLDPTGEAVKWPDGATEMRFGSDAVAVDMDRGLIGVNDWTLSFHPDEARRIGRAMIAAADALEAGQ